MKKLLLSFFCALAIAQVMGQDLHFSQLPLAPFQQNPALAGIFEGDYRVGANYRKQWKSVPVPYETESFFADGKLLGLGNLVIGGGLKLDHDEAGDAAISWTNGTVFGSVSRVLGQYSVLSLGIALGGGQRKFDIDKLRWKSQYIDGAFSPAANSQETMGPSSGFVPEIGAGLNYHFQQNNGRSQFDMGLGSFHLNRPTVSFRDEKASRLAMRFNINATASLQIGALRDFLATANLQKQGPYKEAVISVGMRRWLKPEQTAASFLFGIRPGDAIIPQARLEWGNWLLGLSYDWNISGLNDATLGKGGPEIGLQWRFVKVPPVKVFKVCPIY